MKSKFEIIHSLKGKRVLDIGGCGYAGNSKREKILRDAWSGIHRTTLDIAPTADIVVDLNLMPLPVLHQKYEVAVAFDVLEHVKNPGTVLEWVPADVLWINVPAGTSFNCQRIEATCHKILPDFVHLYSFNALTICNLVKSCGWEVEEVFYTLDRESIFGEIFNCIASCCPSLLAMGIAVKCHRR